MQRDHFIIHLEAFGCTLIREDKKGYSCYRNVQHGTKSGVPEAGPDGTLGPATICRICKTLRIDIPNEVAVKGIVDFDANNMPKASDIIRLTTDRGSKIQAADGLSVDHTEEGDTSPA